jgi:hypothetical protein
MIYGYAWVSTAAQDETGQVGQLKAAGCEKVFREKITETTADRPQLKKLMKTLAPGDVVIAPAVDRLSATQPTYWLSPATCIAPGPVSARWPSRSSIPYPTSPRSSSPSLALRRSSNAAAFSNAPRAAEPTPRRRASNWSQADPHAAPAEGGPQASRSGRDTTQRRAEL